MLRKLLPSLGLIVAVGLIAGGGIVHGLMTNRWQAADATAQIVVRLAALPKNLGPWQLKEEDQIDSQTLKVLECYGHITRTYVDDDTGAMVKVAVLLGPHGPISVHTPEICYSSRDYQIEKPREAVNVDATDGVDDDAWRLTLRSHDIHAHRLRVYYAWTGDGVWQAAANPRFTFAGEPYLLKLQIAGVVSQASDEAASDPCLLFLKAFLPQLRRDLFSNLSKPAPSGANGT